MFNLIFLYVHFFYFFYLCMCVQHVFLRACVFPQWGQKRKEQCSFLLFSDFGLAGLLASLWVSGLSRAITPWQQPAPWQRQRVWPEREARSRVGKTKRRQERKKTTEEKKRIYENEEEGQQQRESLKCRSSYTEFTVKEEETKRVSIHERELLR